VSEINSVATFQAAAFGKKVSSSCSFFYRFVKCLKVREKLMGRIIRCFFGQKLRAQGMFFQDTVENTFFREAK